jgi:hypothetical protein
MPDFKLGRKPPKNAPALRLSQFLSGVVPEHPASADYLGRLSGWKMLGNNDYGDCVAVTWANQRRLMTALLGGKESYPSQTDVIEVYKTQNPQFPNDDNGMDIQTCLEYLVSKGGPDGVKAIAFAKVDYTNPDEAAAAMAIFGHIWLGINVQNANMDDFDAGKPWDYHPNSGIDGGHSVETGGYNPSTPGSDEKFITWAAETSFTDAFWSHLVEEAWVVVWPENLGTTQFLTGIDSGKLAAAFKSLTGHDLPIPTPTPTPQPAGCLAQACDITFWAQIAKWAVLRHARGNKAAALAAQEWAKAKGLI